MIAAGRGTYVCETCQPRPRAAAPSARRRRPVGAEERAQLLRVELGLLERREVPAARAPELDGDSRRFDETEVRLLDLGRGEHVGFVYVYDFGK